MPLQPSQVNGQHLNGVPESLLEVGLERIKERAHLWLCTVVFEMIDENLAKGEIILDSGKIHGQNIRCVVCGMEWRKGREGRICPGGG